MQVATQNISVPKLRFEEFKADWLIFQLNQLTNPNNKYGIVDGPFGSNLKTIHYKTEGVPIITSGYVTSGNFKADNYLYVTQEKYNKEKRSSVKGGDIVMAKIGARCGASAIVPASHQTGILSGNSLKISIDENNYSTYFVWLKLWDLHVSHKFEMIKTVGAQPAISITNLKKFKLALPSLPEQEKIASFLSAVDERIQQLERKKSLLAAYKKGVMHQLFSQEIRFKDDNGNNYPDWEFIRGNELFDSISNKKHNSDLPILAISQEFGAIPRELINYKITVTSNSVSSYKVVEKGDFIISLRSFQGGIEYSNYKGICSPAYIILRPTMEISDYYFKSYFKTYPYIQELTKKLEGIRDGKMISYKYFSEIKLPTPSFEEQQKIASFLSCLDKRIELVDMQIQQSKTFKKGLLQQLFV